MDFAKFVLQEAKDDLDVIGDRKAPRIKSQKGIKPSKGRLTALITDVWNAYLENGSNVDATAKAFDRETLLNYSDHDNISDLESESITEDEWKTFIKNLTGLLDNYLNNNKALNIEQGHSEVKYSDLWKQLMKEHTERKSEKGKNPKTNLVATDRKTKIAVYKPKSGENFYQGSADDSMLIFYSVFNYFVKEATNKDFFDKIMKKIHNNMKSVKIGKNTITKLKDSESRSDEQELILSELLDIETLWDEVESDLSIVFNENPEFVKHFILEVISGYQKFGMDNIGSANFTMVTNPHERVEMASGEMLESIGASKITKNDLDLATRLEPFFKINMSWKPSGKMANTTIKVKHPKDAENVIFKDGDEDKGNTEQLDDSFDGISYLQDIINEHVSQSGILQEGAVADIKSWWSSLMKKLYDGIRKLLEKGIEFVAKLIGIEPDVTIEAVPTHNELYNAI